MRRPLCLIGLAFVIVLLTGIRWIPHGAETFEELDKETVTVLGVTAWKEHKNQNGEKTLVISLEQVIVLRTEQINYLTQVISESEKNSRSSVKRIVKYCVRNREKIACKGTDNIEGLMCWIDGKKEPEKEIPTGSLVILQGQFRSFVHATNPGEFDTADYYRILGMQGRLFQAECLAQSPAYSHFEERLYQIKSYLSLLLDASYPADKAAVMRAVLLGEKGMLDEETKSLYQQSGIIHILAISGLHLSILGMGLHRLLVRLRMPKIPNILLCIAFMYGYGVMTGMGVSVVRALIMFALHLGAALFGRTYDMLTAVTMAALALLIRQPFYLEHSGFLFSFGAICGIGLFLPAVERNLPNGHRVVKTIFAGIGISLSTLPVYLLYYYEFPVYSVVLNLLVIPCMGIVLTDGIVTLLVAAVFLPAAGYTAAAGSLILTVYEKCCALFLLLPGHQWIAGAPRGWQVFLYVAVLAILSVWNGITQTKERGCGVENGRSMRTEEKERDVESAKNMRAKRKTCGAQTVWNIPAMRKWQFWAGVMAAVFVLVLRIPQGLEITMLDVGQGDCICFSEGSGHFLIDGGSSSKKNVDEYQIVPFLKYKGVDRLDGVFVTHPDSDHENGIRAILEKYEENGIKIDMLFLPDVSQKSKNENYLMMEDLARQADVPVHYLSSGEKLWKGKVMLTCLHPGKGHENEDANGCSVVLLLTYKNFSALFTGDLEGEGEQVVTEQLLEIRGKRKTKNTAGRLFGEDGEVFGENGITLLKVAHHGSRNSSRDAFLQAAAPQIALISAGRDNSYGHPHEETLTRLAVYGCRVYQTPESGAVTVFTDGKRVKTETYMR